MEKFKLPGSSYLELVKMIKAYGTKKVGVPCSLDDISKVSALDKSQISRNNGFLIAVGLLKEGKNKAPTELCSNLAKAYSLNINEKIAQIWRETISKNELLSSMISPIIIKASMPKSEYIRHLIYSSGSSNNNNSKAGAAALIEIFKASNILTEDDNTIYPTNDVQNLNYNMLNEEKDENIKNTELNINNKNNFQSCESTKELEDIFVQEYMCTNGKKAKLIIPSDATKDDIITMYEVFKVILKRKYKISEEDLN